MAQTSLADLRGGLGAALESIEGLAVHEKLGGPYNPPCAVVLLREIPSYRESFGRGGIMALPFSVLVFVGRPDDFIAQSNLDEYTDAVGDLSVPAALERDQSLSGVADSVYVENFRLLTAPEVEGYGAFGGEFVVTVRAERERI
jgi:hypothetical protein